MGRLQGVPGLVAEALALWETRFEWVLLYQAKPNALGFEAMLRDIHLKLMGELGRYHEHVKSRPADAIHRSADAEFTGPGRLEMVEGEWDDTTATVMPMRNGRLRIKFVSTGKPGYWERVDE